MGHWLHHALEVAWTPLTWHVLLIGISSENMLSNSTDSNSCSNYCDFDDTSPNSETFPVVSLFQGCLTASSCLQTKCVHQQSQNPPPHGWRCFWSGSALKALIQSSPPDRVQPGKWDYWCWLTVSTNLHTAVSGHTDSDSNQMKFHTHIPKLSLSIKLQCRGQPPPGVYTALQCYVNILCFASAGYPSRTSCRDVFAGLGVSTRKQLWIVPSQSLSSLRKVLRLEALAMSPTARVKVSSAPTISNGSCKANLH